MMNKLKLIKYINGWHDEWLAHIPSLVIPQQRGSLIQFDSRIFATKMLVLHENIKFLRSIGMLLNENQMCESPKGIAYNIAFLVPLTLTLAGMTAYCVTHLTNLAVATQVLYNMAAICIYWIIYLVFALQKPIIRDILAELQMLVLHSKQRSIASMIRKSLKFFSLFSTWFQDRISHIFKHTKRSKRNVFNCSEHSSSSFLSQFHSVSSCHFSWLHICLSAAHTRTMSGFCNFQLCE